MTTAKTCQRQTCISGLHPISLYDMKDYLNEIVLGDCMEVLKNIPDNSIDLVVTDPPYFIPTITGGGTVAKYSKLGESLKDLKKNTDITTGYDIEAVGTELIRVMKDINVYFFCNKLQIPDYFNFWVNKHKCKFDILCYHKTNPVPTYSNKYISDTEYCLYFRKGGNHCHPANYEDGLTYLVAPINIKDKKKYGHPTCKPERFIAKLIRNSSKESDVVLDPYSGSGTTAIACIKEKRNFICIEIDPAYHEASSNRVSDFVDYGLDFS